MIVIKNIDYYEVKENTLHRAIKHNTGMTVKTSKGDSSCVLPFMAIEDIKGRSYITKEGKHIVIGMSVQGQDLLGLQIDAWEELEKEARRYLSERNKAYDTIRTLELMPFLSRLKFLFSFYPARAKMVELIHRKQGK